MISTYDHHVGDLVACVERHENIEFIILGVIVAQSVAPMTETMRYKIGWADQGYADTWYTYKSVNMYKKDLDLLLARGAT